MRINKNPILLVSIIGFCIMGCQQSSDHEGEQVIASGSSAIIAEDYDRANAPEGAVCKTASDAQSCEDLDCEPLFADSDEVERKYLSCGPKVYEDENADEDMSNEDKDEEMSSLECSNIPREAKDPKNDKKVIICHVAGSGKKISISISCHAIPAHLKNHEHDGIKVSLGQCKESGPKPEPLPPAKYN